MRPTRVLCTTYVVTETIHYTRLCTLTLQAPHKHATVIGYVDHVRVMDASTPQVGGGLVRKTLFPVFN